jgi:hypothetical protein
VLLLLLLPASHGHLHWPMLRYVLHDLLLGGPSRCCPWPMLLLRHVLHRRRPRRRGGGARLCNCGRLDRELRARPTAGRNLHGNRSRTDASMEGAARPHTGRDYDMELLHRLPRKTKPASGGRG